MANESKREQEVISKALFECAATGNLHDLVSLVDLKRTNDAGETLLHHAVVNTKTDEILKHLLDNDIPIDVKSKEGRTPLHECAFKDNLHNMKLLVDRGANIKAVDNDGSTALHFACMNKEETEMIQYLLQKGASLEARDNEGRTPLYYCALHGNLQTFELLVALGARVNATAKDGRTTLHAASGNEAGIDIINRLLELGVSIHNKTKNGRTALHFAAGVEKGADMIKYLLGKGISPNVANEFGFKPIHCSAHRGFLANIEALVDGGADIMSKTQDGYTALHSAAGGHGPNTIEYLLNQGIPVNDKTEDGRTPLHACAYSGSLEGMKLLIEHGADIESRTDDGRTILHLAAGGKLGDEILEYLLAKGLQADARTKDGLKPLHWCAYKRTLESMKLLIEKGASIETTANDGRTILHSAAKNDKGTEIIQFLLDNGLAVDAPTSKGQTPLHISCIEGILPNAKLLVEAGANINAQDNSGCTARRFAANKRAHELVRYLDEMSN